jgi:nucleotide-binding universal stress UspA family protein
MQKLIVILTSLETASAVIVTAGKFTSFLASPEVRFIHPRPEIDPDLMPTEEVYTEERRTKFELQREQLFRSLEHLVAGSALGKSQPLHQRCGKVSEIIDQESALADLVIVGSPHADPEAQQALDIALVRNMKPVLLVSRNLRPSLCDHIAVAWEDEPPAHRALDAILEVTRGAKTVTFLIGGEGTHFSDPPAAAIKELERIGASCTLTHFTLNGRHVGEALLAEAHDVGADMLVMGAFFHSHLREVLLGGATLEILKDLDLPILLHH